MRTKEGYQLEIRRLYHLELQKIRALMVDVISRLPFQDLFEMDDEDYFIELIYGKGEYTVLLLMGNWVLNLEYQKRNCPL
jgi:hypothetical protein